MTQDPDMFTSGDPEKLQTNIQANQILNETNIREKKCVDERGDSESGDDIEGVEEEEGDEDEEEEEEQEEEEDDSTCKITVNDKGAYLIINMLIDMLIN